MNYRLTAVMLPVLLVGCAASPPLNVTSFRDPADPHAEIRRLSHSTPVAGYTARMPVDPEPWKKLNKDIGAVDGATP